MLLTNDFTPGPGGVMTAEVGVVTGGLTLATDISDAGDLVLRVRYTGADEWYTVADGRTRLPAPVSAELGEAVHRLALGVLGRGGPVPPGTAGWIPAG